MRFLRIGKWGYINTKKIITIFNTEEGLYVGVDDIKEALHVDADYADNVIAYVHRKEWRERSEDELGR